MRLLSDSVRGAVELAPVLQVSGAVEHDDSWWADTAPAAPPAFAALCANGCIRRWKPCECRYCDVLKKRTPFFMAWFP